VHRGDAEDAEMLQLLSPRTLRLGGESQVTSKLAFPDAESAPMSSDDVFAELPRPLPLSS